MDDDPDPMHARIPTPDDWDVAALDDRQAPFRPLPMTVEQITADWLTAALSSKAPGLKATSVEITEVRHGFTSLIFATIGLNEAGRQAGVPGTIVIKGGFTQHSRAYFFGYGMEA